MKFPFFQKNKISPGKIKEHLTSSTWDHIEYLGKIDSTNEYLKRKKDTPHKTVVIANRQTAGKGRMDRSFFSPKGGIYMSLLLHPDSSMEDTSFLTVTAAVAVRNALVHFSGNDVKIKWINDLFVQNKKICGILCESSFSSGKDSPDYVIVGIGVNLYSTRFPKELRDIAGTLSNCKMDKNQVIAAILDEFHTLTHPLDKKAVLEAYKDASMVLGKEVFVYSGNETYEAVAVDINEDAHLIVETKSGERKTLCAGEVRIKL